MNKPTLKSRSTSRPATAGGLGKTVADSAQQIWLAGLGAFAKAQKEGGKLFESLVKEGMAVDARTRKLTETKVDAMRGAAEQMRERSQETWDKLEQVFEKRVSGALSRLGVPNHAEIKALSAKVEELAREVRKQGGAAPRKRVAGARKRG